MTEAETKRPLTRRERVVVRLILLAVWILAPWDMSYQARDHLDGILRELRACNDD